SQNIARRPEWFSTIVHALAEDAAAHPRGVGTVTGTGLGLPNLGILNAPTGPAAPSAAGTTMLRLRVKAPATTRGGESIQLLALLHVAEGYHVQLNAPADREAFRTIVHLRGELELDCDEWKFPEAAAIHDTQGHAGDVELRVTC